MSVFKICIIFGEFKKLEITNYKTVNLHESLIEILNLI